MIYTATITSASLRLRESRIIAELLLDGTDTNGWVDALHTRNVLQMANTGSIRRISRLLRARLEPMGPGLWELVRDGDRLQSTQAVFASAVNQSRLLGDFLDIAVRDQLALFATTLEYHVWIDYLEGCRGRDPDMPHWSDSTNARLRSAVFSMLAEAGYLESTRSRRLQPVFVDETLAAHLRANQHHYVLRCLEVTE